METTTKTKINSYLSFKLGDEVFAANVSKVLNILEMTKITKVPQAPDYMKGVINLRGTVLPLVDTRKKFGMPETEFTTNTCILVLDVNLEGDSVMVGALVDSVKEVLEIDDKSVQPPPSIGSKYKSEFIEGVVDINDEFVMILNMDLIFSTHELTVLQASTAEVIAKGNAKETEEPVKEKKPPKAKK
ncbi:MAG: chemotaxis protein CheW [Bacteroidales bacterium]|nr:chemotaxis protein CheW [Bacteroidales bacterium]